MKPKSNGGRPIRTTYALVILGVVVILAGGWLYYHHTKTPVKTTTVYNPQTQATKNQTGSPGGVVDNSTSTTTKTPASSTSTSTTTATPSDSGVITLTSPTANATIGNGTAVSGRASGLSQVQYRIKDTVRGVIASGQLSVVNGSFSGTINGIEAGSASGTFEVYDFNATSGAEENDAKINVSFK